VRNGLTKEIDRMREDGTWDTFSVFSQEYLIKEAELSACQRYADPASGEALLCTECMEDSKHMESNMVPKRLPRREAVYGASA
jgi:hypothetical protein